MTENSTSQRHGIGIYPGRVGTQTDILGESPVWDDRTQSLFWVDIRAPSIRRYQIETGRISTWGLPGLVGSIALADDGRLLVAMPNQVSLFDPSDGQLELLVAGLKLPEGQRFNDGRCDSFGRFWVGSMHNTTRAPEGRLFVLEGREVRRVAKEGIAIPNSLAFSPDSRTMYFADSLKYRIDMHPFDLSTGELGAARLFAETVPPAFPDGSAVDSEGYLWNAEFNGARLVRYSPKGEVDREVKLPVNRPTCCAFGGPDLDILFITSTSQGMSEEQRKSEPFAGALMAFRPGVRGLPEARYRVST